MRTNGCGGRVGARVFDVVGGDFGGLGVEEGEEGLGKGEFGRHFGSWSVVVIYVSRCLRSGRGGQGKMVCEIAD